MDYFEDGNYLGRFLAVALVVGVGYGIHRINCGGGMCPVMKTESCCAPVAAPSAAPSVPPQAPSLPPAE